MTWTLDTNLVNGSFDTGDYTGWTLTSGSATPRFTSPAWDGSAGYHLRGPSAGSCSLYQDIPVGGAAVRLFAAVGNNFTDYDSAQAWVEFRDSGGVTLGKACSYVLNDDDAGSSRWETPDLPIVAVVPAGAVTLRVWVALLKEDAGTGGNGVLDDVEIYWSAITPDLGANMVVNGGFETGDFTGWALDSGDAGGLTTTGYLVPEGTYALGEYNGPDTSRGQNIDVTGIADGLTEFWFTVANGANHYEDHGRGLIRGYDASNVLLFSYTIMGPANVTEMPSPHNTEQATRYTSVPIVPPADCTRIRVNAQIRRRSGTAANGTVDDLRLQLAEYGPEITEEPADQSVFDGDTATFESDSVGVGTITYQWRKDAVDIPGETGKDLMWLAALADDGALFSCAHTDDNGTAYTRDALLTVAPDVTVTDDPDDASVQDLQEATFTGAVLASGPYTIQWRIDGVDVPGATSEVFTFPVDIAMDGALIDFYATSDGATAYSNTATLTVTKVPFSWVQHPASRSAYPAEQVTFYAAATGRGSISYQWQELTAGDITGETSTALDFEAYEPLDGNQYRLEATDYYGDSYYSDYATLTVLQAPTCVVTDVRVMGPDGEWVSIMGPQGADSSANVINDGRIALDQTWSSDRINRELQGKANLTDVPNTRRYVHGGAPDTTHRRYVHGGAPDTLHSIFHTLHGGSP